MFSPFYCGVNLYGHLTAYLQRSSKNIWQAELNRYCNLQLVDPVELLYKFNRMDNAFGIEL